MNTATITHKGQVTIPKPVRDALDLKEHDKVIFVVTGERATMMPVRQGELERVRGIAGGRVMGVIATGRQAERAAARKHVAQHVIESVTEE